MKTVMNKLVATSAIFCGLLLGQSTAEVPKPPIIPTPKSIVMGSGYLRLTPSARIVATDPRLEAHAAALQEEVWMLTNWKLEVVKSAPVAGDIVLKINPALEAGEEILAPRNMKLTRARDMAHAIEVGEQVVVEGADLRAVCEGTASVVLSLIDEGNGRFKIPQMKIKDWPHADYSGVMIDCGRQWIPEDTLKMLVECCRLYKVRYINLHVGDDQGYSMPSKAFPKLGTANGSCCEGVPPKLWSWNKLVELEAYAVARGVGIVPELETPGHHQAMARSYRDVFDGPGCMDMCKEELYKGLDTVIGEMCSIFKSAPYFSIGCDEANNGCGAGPWAEIYKRRHALPDDAQSIRNGYEAYIVHMKRMADICRKYGKLTMAYENFPDDGRLAKDIIVKTWYPHAVAQNYQNKGFTTITVPWELGVPFTEWNMYICNGSRMNKGDRVLGAMSTMWQMSAICVTVGWGQGICGRSEKTWGPDTKLTQGDFDARQAASRIIVDRIVKPVRMTTRGLDGGGEMGLHHFLTGRTKFGGAIQVTLSATFPAGGEIRYTTDDSEPKPQSTLYTEPLMRNKTFMLNAAYFVNGKQVGTTTRAKYDWNDIDGNIEDWMVAGPYLVPGKSGQEIFDVPFEPEKGGQANWIRYKTGNPSWLIGFDKIPGFAGENRIAYARTKVYSPKTQKALLTLYSDDAVKVWLNGKVVHAQNKGRYANEQDRVAIDLNEGWNQLLFKVINWGGGYEAQGSIRAANGGKFEGLKVQAE